MSVPLQSGKTILVELFARRPRFKRWRFSELYDTLEALAVAPGDPLEARLVRTERRGRWLLVQLHPSEEPVIFSPANANELAVAVVTSNAGPGYHAFAMEWLDWLAGALGTVWRPPEGEPGDPTGYREHRSAALLQHTHAARLATVARHLLDDVIPARRQEPVAAAVAMGLADGDPVPAGLPEVVASTTGLWDTDFLEALVAAEPRERLPLAARFFPWWDPHRDAAFWAGVGRALAWNRLWWHPPVDDDDREVSQFVLDAFARARALDPTLPLPESEITELATLLLPDAPVVAPEPEGIGLRRRLLRIPLPGDWSLELPGYFYETHAREGDVWTFSFLDRTVVFENVTSGPATWRPRVADSLIGLDPVPPGAIWYRDGRHVGCAGIRALDPDERPPARWCLEGRMAVFDHLCRVTVTFADEADRPWAEALWRGVRRGRLAPAPRWPGHLVQ